MCVIYVCVRNVCVVYVCDMCCLYHVLFCLCHVYVMYFVVVWEQRYHLYHLLGNKDIIYAMSMSVFCCL